MIYKKENIDMSLVQCGYEEDRGYIHIADDYTNNILRLAGYIDIDNDDVGFIQLCETTVLENHIPVYAIKSASRAYHYVRYVIGGRFELAENILSTDAYYSCLYASVVNGRFELGEPVISTSPVYSYIYAMTVLDGRFELGESTIAEDAQYSYYYARDIFKGRFELGEKTISSNMFFKKKYFELTGIEL